MKRFLFTILCLVHGGLSLAQNVPSDQLAAWTPEQLDKAITASTGGQRGLDLLNKVLETRRLDLLAVCFGHQLTKYHTIRAVTKMPEGEFRHRAVITMFRTPSTFWPREEEESIVLGRSMLDPDYLLIEPFTSTMSQLLPGVKFDVPLIRYQADREKLAVTLEAALDASLNAAKQPPASPIDTPKSKTPPPPPAAPVKTAAAPPQPATPAPPSESGGREIVAWVAGLIAALAAYFGVRQALRR